MERTSAWYARTIVEKLKAAAGMRVEYDDRNEKKSDIGKIREAQLEKVPYMLVIGDKAEAGAVAIRSRKEGDKGAMGCRIYRYADADEVQKNAVKAKEREPFGV